MDTKAEASRVSGYKVIQNIADIVPTYISGGADLHDSTRNYIDGGGGLCELVMTKSTGEWVGGSVMQCNSIKYH